MNQKKTPIVILLLIVIIIIDISGYIIIERSNFLNALYMTIISISTVGYGEAFKLSSGGKIFTIWVILSGLSIFLYFIGNFAEIIVEKNIRKLFGRRKMKKLLKIKGHIIIAGFGTLGHSICKELKILKEKFLIIELDSDRYAKAEETGYNVLLGDAANEDILLNAGIKSSKAFISLLSSDADNIISIMTAKELNPKLNIVTRAVDFTNESKLHKAGAGKVILPNELVSFRIINSALRNNIGEFIDFISFSPKLSIGIEELIVVPDSIFVGKKILESGLRKNYNIMIIAINRDEEIIFNPSSSLEIAAGDTLLVVGEKSKLMKIKHFDD